VYERFEASLQRANAVTFDDLLTLPVSLLRDDAEVRRSLSGRFRYVLVDEYQDTNPAQYQLVKRLGTHGNVFVVGDDDQSIYGWRGADVRNILEFERDFPDAQVVRLEENYRSTPSILTFANAVIAENATRHGKMLRATRPSGESVTVVSAADDRDEAEFVVDEILTGRSESRALTLGSFAVLYRTNAQSRPLEEELRRRGIPYRLIGQIRFYERREIRDLVAWLRLVANPADNEAFRRAVAAPRRGIGGGTLGVIADAAAAAGVSLLEAAHNADLLPVRASTRSAVAEFVGIVDTLRARAPELAVDELLREVLDATGYPDWLRGEEPDADDRLANVYALAEGAADVRDELEGEAGLAPLDLFLQRIALITSADEADSDEGAVTLMTLHNAKGLEFPVVFVTGLEDGLLPLVRAGMEDESAIEEERRLFYVGVTRAEDRLYVTHAQRRWRNGESMPSMPSRFLRDLASGVAESRRTLRARAHGSYRTDGHGGDDVRAAPDRRAPRRGTPVDWGDAISVHEDESQDAPLYRVGERVRHTRFGSGTIVELGGQGAAAKARIDFDDESVGRKTLMLAQANLERGWE
jgi:DNA helicase-2/ATP-dependent DNA helicase PcrA